MTLRELITRALQGAIDLDTEVVICDRNNQNRQPIRGVSVFVTEAGKHLGLCADEQKSDAVSAQWVVNQLAGLSFPIRGGAYDYMKRCLERK